MKECDDAMRRLPRLLFLLLQLLNVLLWREPCEAGWECMHVALTRMCACAQTKNMPASIFVHEPHVGQRVQPGVLRSEFKLTCRLVDNCQSHTNCSSRSGERSGRRQYICLWWVYSQSFPPQGASCGALQCSHR